MAVAKVSRRDFLKVSAKSSSGLVLGASVISQPISTFAAGTPFPIASNAPVDALALNVFVHIDTDDKVYIVASRSEMGQGIRTSLAQVVADELDASWEKVVVLQAQGNAEYGNQNTDGSRSVRDLYGKMREVGAAARHMLREAAAKKWDIAIDRCAVKNHRVTKIGTKESFSFGELAEAASQVKVPKLDALVYKKREDFRYIGKAVEIVDMKKIVSGDSVYGMDTTLPGMLFASIERCPFLGGTVKKFDASAAKKIPGVVKVLEVEPRQLPAIFHPLAGVAVIATNTWAALEARKKLSIEWNSSRYEQHDSRQYLQNIRDALVTGPYEVVRKKGDLKAEFAQAKDALEASYSVPYLAHAPMEPPAALAVTQKDKIEVWACTQTPQAAQRELAQRLGIKKEKVFVNVTLLGGGFGRKSKPDFIVEAALLSKAMDGKPVRLMWSREDEIQHAYYHAISVINLKAAWDSKNKITAWRSRACYPSMASTWNTETDRPSKSELELGLTNTPFDIASEQVETAPIKTQTRIGWLRSVCNIQQAFAVNSFVDELAKIHNVNPLDYWLKLIGEDRDIDYSAHGYEFGNMGKPVKDYPFETKRLKNVLKLVVKNSGSSNKTKTNEGWGIACHYSFLTHVAIATKVNLDNDLLSVKEVHCVVDSGLVVNPDRVKAQMEGAVVFGLSAALMGEITFKSGSVEQSNFDDYPVLRISQCPDIHVYIVDSQASPRGIGEPGVPPVAPSLTNAIVAAGGKRIYDLPVNKLYRV